MKQLDYSAVQTGIRHFVRMVPLRNDTNMKHIQDEFDAEVAIDSISDHLRETEHLIGKKLYRGTAYDPIQDTKAHLESWLLIGKTEKETALLRRKNLSMYHLILVPTIEVLRSLDHAEMISRVQEVVDQVREFLLCHNIDGNYDDALVAKAIVSELIKERETARKATMKKRRRKSSKKKDEEFLVEPEVEPLEL